MRSAFIRKNFTVLCPFSVLIVRVSQHCSSIIECGRDNDLQDFVRVKPPVKGVLAYLDNIRMEKSFVQFEEITELIAGAEILRPE